LDIILAAQAADWAPIRHRHQGQDQLHDRASFRYFWQVIQRAHRTGLASASPSIRQAVEGFFETAETAAGQH
jgi:citrate lyase subunit beta/citryl-CoA lyase